MLIFQTLPTIIRNDGKGGRGGVYRIRMFARKTVEVINIVTPSIIFALSPGHALHLHII
jgi:hypothetical protein